MIGERMDSRRLTRRQFGKALSGVVAAGVLPRFARAREAEAWTPRVGVVTSIHNAAMVREAGGDFISENVARFLDPDSSEAEFAPKLELVKKAPLPILSCNSFIRRRDLKCTGPEANHDKVMVYAIEAFKRARRAGVKMITFGSSGARRLPEGFPYEEGIRQFSELLARMGPEAGAQGVSVVVEPLRKEECNFINRIGEVERVVRLAGHPAIQGTADLYHMILGGDTPTDLARAADIVGHVEIAEPDGRRMPGSVENGYDFRPFFRVLKQADYRGAIGAEGRWEPEDLRGGFATLRQQWKEA